MCNSIDKTECVKTKEDYINAAVAGIKNDVDQQRVAMELRNHIEDRAQYYREIGFDTETAMQKAVAQMGDPEEISAPLSQLHPKGGAASAVAAVIGVLVALFILDVYRFFALGDGVIGFGISEFLRLLYVVGLSIMGTKRKNRALSGLSIVVFFLTYSEYFWWMLEANMLPCSPIVLGFFSIVTGDFDCLSMYGRVGEVTVAPWITYATVAFYIGIMFVLIVSFVSVCKQHQPTYGLWSERIYRGIGRMQKGVLSTSAIIVCISLVAAFFSICFEHYPTKPATNDDSYFFDTVVILQSDTPCRFEEVDPNDILIFDAHLDWSWYISNWYLQDYDPDREKEIAYDTQGEFVSVTCGNKLEYQFKKDVITAEITKKYVCIAFINASSISFIGITEEDWQEAETVKSKCAAYNAYNCVEVVVNAS